MAAPGRAQLSRPSFLPSVHAGFSCVLCRKRSRESKLPILESAPALGQKDPHLKRPLESRPGAPNRAPSDLGCGRPSPDRSRSRGPIPFAKALFPPKETKEWPLTDRDSTTHDPRARTTRQKPRRGMDQITQTILDDKARPRPPLVPMLRRSRRGRVPFGLYQIVFWRLCTVSTACRGDNGYRLCDHIPT